MIEKIYRWKGEHRNFLRIRADCDVDIHASYLRLFTISRSCLTRLSDADKSLGLNSAMTNRCKYCLACSIMEDVEEGEDRHDTNEMAESACVGAR